MPSSPNYVRDYKQERITAMRRGETNSGSSSKDATRHRARRAMEKKLGRKLKPSEHVDHKRKLKDGGSNSLANLRVRSASENSADNGHKPKKKNRLPVKRP